MRLALCFKNFHNFRCILNNGRIQTIKWKFWWTQWNFMPTGLWKKVKKFLNSNWNLKKIKFEDNNTNLIDPRTYYYARPFLEAVKQSGQPLALITTWVSKKWNELEFFFLMNLSFFNELELIEKILSWLKKFWVEAMKLNLIYLSWIEWKNFELSKGNLIFLEWIWVERKKFEFDVNKLELESKNWMEWIWMKNQC